MEITRFDITVLVATSTAIILMSLVFPPMGLVDAGNTTNTSEIPEFSMDADRFDIAGDFPPRPGSAGSPSDRIVTGNSTFIFGNENFGAELEYVTNGSTQVDFVLLAWDDGSIQGTETFTHDSAGESNTTQITDGELQMSTIEIRNSGDAQNLSATGQWSILGGGGDGGSWVTDIPIVGSLVEGGQEVAAGVVWIGQIIRFFALTAFELLLNGINVVVDVTTFLFALTSWLVTTYSSITTANNLQAWAQLVLLIPSVLFAMVWAKLAVVAFDAIWIG